jgi:hypothetical protein
LQALVALLALAMLGLAVTPSDAATGAGVVRPATAIMPRNSDRTSRL